MFFIIKNVAKVNVIKHCVVCGVPFMGKDASRYCPNHKIKPTKKPKTSTLLEDWCPVVGKYTEKTIVMRPCDCCGIDYTYVIFADTLVMPKYCELHRNKYKRELYLKGKK